jgi:hypothetical protein
VFNVLCVVQQKLGEGELSRLFFAKRLGKDGVVESAPR